MTAFSFREIYQGVSQLVFPLRCVQCNTKLVHQALPACPVCMDNIERVNAVDMRSHVAEICPASTPLQFAYAHWYFDNSGIVQHLHHGLKYANRPEYGIELGIMMGHGLRKTSPSNPDYIVPIPLHKSRMLERGYNQSTMLARGIAEIVDSILDETVLSRDAATRSQTGLTKRQRQENVQSAFSISQPARLQHAHVLLIDDVLTTGATLFSAAQTLYEAGVSTISVATLAFTRP